MKKNGSLQIVLDNWGRKIMSMSRKQFIESQGATCRNWTWSWSFINEKDKVIIFGAWGIYTDAGTALIFDKTWQIDKNGKKTKGYKQSRDHINLIENEGYKLQTFPLVFGENEDGMPIIKDFIPKLIDKELKRVGDGWYASDGTMNIYPPEEVVNPEQYLEGASKKISVNSYERNSAARAKCIEHYGYKCIVCSFDFEKTYGSIGRNYIHVHHIVSLSKIKKEYKLDPVKDLVPVCPNCHAIIHRTKPELDIEQLKLHLVENK